MSRPKRRKHEARRRSLAGPKPLPTHGAPSVVSFAAAAEYLGVHPSTLRRWIQSGRLTAEPGGAGGIRMEEIARVLALRGAEGS